VEKVCGDLRLDPPTNPIPNIKSIIAMMRLGNCKENIGIS
jgi:hypothetical protein